MIAGVKVTQIPLVMAQLSTHKKKLKQISTRKLLHLTIPELQYQQYLKDSKTAQTTNMSRSFLLTLSKYRGFASLSLDQKQRLKTKKQNHQKSINFHKSQRQFQIQHGNQIIYSKIVSIRRRKDVNNLKSFEKEYREKRIRRDKFAIVECEEERIGSSEKGEEGYLKSKGNQVIGKVFDNQFTNSDRKFKQNKKQKRMGKDFVYRKKQLLAIQSTNAQLGKRLMNKTGYYDHKKDLQNFSKNRQILNRMQRFKTIKKLIFSPSKKRTKTLPIKLPHLNNQDQFVGI